MTINLTSKLALIVMQGDAPLHLLLENKGFVPRAAVCHRCCGLLHGRDIEPGQQGDTSQGLKNYSKSSNNLSKQRPLCKRGEKTQETDE